MPWRGSERSGNSQACCPSLIYGNVGPRIEPVAPKMAGDWKINGATATCLTLTQTCFQKVAIKQKQAFSKFGKSNPLIHISRMKGYKQVSFAVYISLMRK